MTNADYCLDRLIVWTDWLMLVPTDYLKDKKSFCMNTLKRNLSIFKPNSFQIVLKPLPEWVKSIDMLELYIWLGEAIFYEKMKNKDVFETDVTNRQMPLFIILISWLIYWNKTIDSIGTFELIDSLDFNESIDSLQTTWFYWFYSIYWNYQIDWSIWFKRTLGFLSTSIFYK